MGASLRSTDSLDGHGRLFQVWDYTVGHGQLLLRSVRQDQYPTRIDILFKDVAYLSLPTVFRLASIGPADSWDGDDGLIDGRAAYALHADPQDGVVVAGVMFVVEDELSHNDPSPFAPSLHPSAVVPMAEHRASPDDG